MKNKRCSACKILFISVAEWLHHVCSTLEEGRNSCNQNHGRVIGVYSNGSILCVACLGAVGDWAAYWTVEEAFLQDVGREERIAYTQRRGTKMNPTHAFKLFPWLNPKKWRA